jgi:hypothetical protein
LFLSNCRPQIATLCQQDLFFLFSAGLKGV